MVQHEKLDLLKNLRVWQRDRESKYHGYGLLNLLKINRLVEPVPQSGDVIEISVL